MTNEEINNALLKRRGYKQYEGNKDNLSPLMYFFMFDASKQVFDKDVRKQTCSGPQKRLMNQMEEGFHLFFKNFFLAFNQEQIEYLIEKADEFEEYIQHHLDIAEIAVQECDNSRPIDEQREESRVWLCNLLAADAQDFHGECWKTGRIKPLYDRYIDQVLKASKEYAKLRFGSGPEISEKKSDRVQMAVQIIAKKAAWWIYEDYKRELAKKHGTNNDTAKVQVTHATPPLGDEENLRRGRGDAIAEADIRGAEGDGSQDTRRGRMHDATGGRPAGQEPRNDYALQRPYGGFPVIPRVRGGAGTLDKI